MRDLSEFDLLQLDRLEQKAGWEGSLTYAVENWPWPFDDAELDVADRTNDVAILRAAIGATRDKREQWWEAHPHPMQVEPLNAHEVEAERREAARVAEANVGPDTPAPTRLPMCPSCEIEHAPPMHYDAAPAPTRTGEETCGDCITGRCHWGGETSRESEAAVMAGLPFPLRCGCARHDASVRVRDWDGGPDAE